VSNKATVTVTDRGANKTLATVKKKPAIDVGIIGKEAAQKHSKGWSKGSKATLAAIAGFHEFGTKHIPKRPFIGGYLDKFKGELQAFVAELTGKFLEGKITSERFVDILGVKAVGGIQKYMASKIPPPLAPSTIRHRLKMSSAKGAGKKDKPGKDKRGRTRRAKSTASATPLIDTGLLRSSINYRLHRVK